MAEDQGKKRLKDPYRLVLIKEDTLEEVGSYRLTWLNVYILISSAIVLTSLLVLALIFYTPLKRLVPGYGNIEENREYMELYKQVKALEEEVAAQQLYAERFRTMILGGTTDSLAGELSTADDRYEPSVPREPASLNISLDADQEPTASFPEETTVKSNLTSGIDIDYLYMIPPVKGPVSAGYNSDEGHFGIDVLAPRNTPIKSILDGYVITSDWTLETGNTIGIQHANNIVSFYKHNARNLKQLGSFVKAGEAVAIIGNTGEQSSGPHLHFELWVDGKPVDPANFIAF